MRKWLRLKLFFLLLIVVKTLSASELAPENIIYQDKTKIVAQQIDLLKKRLVQTQNQLKQLQDQESIKNSLDQVSKDQLTQAGLDITVAQANLDSINIEIAESQQTIAQSLSETQEIENQLNVYNIFGLKISKDVEANLTNLRAELDFEKNLLQLEKNRLESLQQLQSVLKDTLQFYRGKYFHIQSALKSQTVMKLKEQQAKYELGFQEQQNYWLEQLNVLYAQLGQLQHSKTENKALYEKLSNDIFYANENANYSYLQMLMARYQDEIQQIKISINRTNSITLLNKASDKAQLLGKQLSRINDLLVERIHIVSKRTSQPENAALALQYNQSLKHVGELNHELIALRGAVDQALKRELSSRQGLPGFDAKEWIDFSAELMLIPPLTFQVIKSLTQNMICAVQEISLASWAMILALESFWIGIFYYFSRFLNRIVAGVPDHEYGHVNLKWLLIKVTRRCLKEIMVLGGLVWLFAFCGLPAQNFNFIVNLGIVWLFFKIILTTARLCLVETVHNKAGHDVRLYHRLKASFIVGGVITALSVFVHGLPLVFEVKDLFDRLFLVFSLIVSFFLLRSWRVLPGLILPHVDDKHTYVKRVVRLLCVFVPLILLVNSLIGLLGYVNFIQTISWYQSIFLLVLVSYLFVRGLMNDAMHFVSQILIRHLSNGWLWTEAILKPIDKILKLMLFLSSWLILFEFYGWDRQSPVIKFLIYSLHYPLLEMLNTSITLMNILELCVVISILYWAARWTREFMYRFLLSRTSDLGVRNSIAILSQYSVILVGVFICLRVLGIDFRALTFVASAFALGVGLGLRDLVNNFACGFLLLLERPVRVGDIVTINDHEGEVMHIGSRAVTVRTWDHMDVLVPNAEIFSKTFINWTAKDNIIRTVFSIKINNHDRPEDVQKIIHSVLAHHKAVLKDPEAEVFIKDLSGGKTEFEVRYYINIRQVKSRVGIRSEILIAIWEAFEKAGIKPPYPHHEVFLKTASVDMPFLVKSEA